MKYSVIGYFLSEGFRNVFKNKKSTFACLGVMCVTMLMFGIFFAIGKNITHMMNSIEGAQAIQVFALIGTSEEDIEKMKSDILAIDGVADAKLITPEEGYNTLRKELGNPEAMEGIEPEIIPASYMVTLKDLDLNDKVQEEISKIDNFDGITSSNKTITTLASLGRGVRMVTGIILAILILISIFIIANTIKLTVHARRKEISIMKYVGATNGFIRWPFMVEGILIGVIASFISILVLGITYNVTTEKIITSLSAARVHINLLTFSSMFNLLIVVYLILGIGIGTIGSAISMKKYLEV